MKREYQISDAAAKEMLYRMLILLAVSAAAAAAVVFLGLKQWSRSQYILVNIPLLLITALGGYAMARFGGMLDGKPNADRLSKTMLLALGGAALGLWVLLTIADAHYSMSVIIFVVDLALVWMMCKRSFGTVQNVWKDLSSDSDGNGDALSYPGRFVLHDVHTGDALTSPMGKVLIGNNTVLFLLVDQSSGQILVRPDGSLEARKMKLLKDETKEIHINVHDLLTNGEQGAQRMIRIVEEACAKQGIAVPEMGYSFAMFLPNFQRENAFYDEGAFHNSTWTNKLGSYRQYVNKAQTADYFSGRACFDTRELADLLQRLDSQYAAEHPGKRDTADLELVTQCIAQACSLVPKA